MDFFDFIFRFKTFKIKKIQKVFNFRAGPRGCDVALRATWQRGGVRPPSPPRYDTTAPEEPTPARVQPPRQVKTKDAEFHYTK